MTDNRKIIDNLELLNDAAFNALIQSLIYNRALDLGLRGEYPIVSARGINLKKNKSRKSAPYSDINIDDQNISVEVSVDENWEGKLKGDIKTVKNRKTSPKIFVFATNRDTKNKELKIRKKGKKDIKVDAEDYCRRELKCEKAIILGQQEIVTALQTPDFFHIRRLYLSIADDFFINSEDFEKNILVDWKGLKLEQYKKKSINLNKRELSEQMVNAEHEYLILFSEDENYQLLLLLISRIATDIKVENQKKKGKDTKKNFAFIRMAMSQDPSVGKFADEIKNKGGNFVVVWDAHNIKNLSDYLYFTCSDNKILFVCPVGRKNEIKKVIEDTKSNDLDVEEIFFQPTYNIPKSKILVKTKKHKKLISKGAKKLENNLLKYEALIYLYAPLDKNDNYSREKIRAILKVNKEEEGLLMETLLTNKHLKCEGSLVFLSDISIGANLLDEFIADGTFNLDDLLLK